MTPKKSAGKPKATIKALQAEEGLCRCRQAGQGRTAAPVGGSDGDQYDDP